MHFPEPVQLSPREQMQLSAFADALAAALHDAASHRELQALSQRSLHAASHDALTQLANRDALLAKGNGALRVLERETPVALFRLDGRPHLAGVTVPRPDLTAYRALREGGAS